jgi:hypothetical protein
MYMHTYIHVRTCIHTYIHVSLTKHNANKMYGGVEVRMQMSLKIVCGVLKSNKISSYSYVGGRNIEEI